MTIRITCLIKRRPDLTHEQFSEHWSKKHGEIFTSLKAVKTNIVRYNQFHVLEPQSKVAAAAGLPIAEFDGAAEFWVDTIQDLFALFGDEEYLKNAVPDEGNFLDRSSVQILVGEDQTKWERASN